MATLLADRSNLPRPVRPRFATCRDASERSYRDRKPDASRGCSKAKAAREEQGLCSHRVAVLLDERGAANPSLPPGRGALPGKAAMSYVGSGAVASTPEGDEPAWTKGGEFVPYMPFTEDGSAGSSRQEIEEAEIPVGETNGPVLLVAAGDERRGPPSVSRAWRTTGSGKSGVPTPTSWPVYS